MACLDSFKVEINKLINTMKTPFLLLVTAVVAFTVFHAHAGESKAVVDPAPAVAAASSYVEPFGAYLFDGPSDYAAGVRAGYLFTPVLGVQATYAYAWDFEEHLAALSLVYNIIDQPNFSLRSSLGGGLLSNGANRAVGMAGLDLIFKQPFNLPANAVVGGHYVYGDESADQFGMVTAGLQFKF